MNRRLLWSSASLLAIIAAAVVWLVFYRLSPFTLWLLAQRSEAIAYAEFRPGTDPRFAYITDIWKQAHGPERLSAGTAIDFGRPYSDVYPRPVGVLLFFDSGSSREFRHLRGSSRQFLSRDRRVWFPGCRRDLSFEEARALCQRTIGI